jgi:hypothetical protein
VARSRLPSSGRLGYLARLRLSCLEAARQCWNGLLDRVSPLNRRRLQGLARPIITWIKQTR